MRLLDKPEYDFSKLPAYYQAIAALQLAQDEQWYKRHQTKIEEAKSFLLELKETSVGQKIIKAHIREVSFLKKDLDSWLATKKHLRSGSLAEVCPTVFLGFTTY